MSSLINNRSENLRSHTDLLTSLPNDNLALIISKLSKEDFYSLIKAYPNLQLNETLWCKTLFLIYKNKNIAKTYGNNYYITYVSSLVHKEYEIVRNECLNILKDFRKI